MKNSPDLEAQNATLKAKLKRARAKILKLKSKPAAAQQASNVERVRPADKRQPYVAGEGQNAEGSHTERKKEASRIIVLVPGVNVDEILKRIA